ncbi:UNVERIFIED_CONTAM: Polygalacturonase [Sesamum radiatum]|uniref:Polygalacturonase n=1 Tax=Sesamum radiatum TaxID=300843 RepID=A0AAW2QG97_SESRA
MAGLCIWMLLMAMVAGNNAAVFDVKSYGARPRRTMPSSAEASTIVIPKGTYMVGTVRIAGPCTAPITIEANKARFVAPIDPNQLRSHNGWINFAAIDKFTLQEEASNTTSTLLGCNNVTFRSIRVSRLPTKSLKHRRHPHRAFDRHQRDRGRHQTGDECVSVGDGSQQVNIEKVKCGPGHGIVVGSLGKYNNEEPVVGVTVKNCTLTNTLAGVRVETWPASPSEGVARDLHFQNIVMNNVGTPISIDQEYCPYKCDKKYCSQTNFLEPSLQEKQASQPLFL